MFGEFEELGLIDGYESVIASVGYEYIEAHVLETCRGRWRNTMLDVLRLECQTRWFRGCWLLMLEGLQRVDVFFCVFRGVVEESVALS